MAWPSVSWKEGSKRMKKFWKATLVPGLCCILAGAVLAIILVVGCREELIKNWDQLSINKNNFWEYFEVDEYRSVTRSGKHYDKGDTKESYHFAVPEGETITGIDFEFAVGEVEIKNGDRMEVNVEEMFEKAITSEVKDGVWYIKDSLISEGKVHSDYSPNISISIPRDAVFEQVDIHLAAGLFQVDRLTAEDIFLEVDAGSLKIFKLSAEEQLQMKNGVGEINVYDAKARNLIVDNGIGALSFTGALTGDNKIKSGIGEVELNLTDRDEVDFNYKVSCGIGEVEIGNLNYHGDVEYVSSDRSDADYFELDCGIGHIEINLAGN